MQSLEKIDQIMPQIKHQNQFSPLIKGNSSALI